MIELNVMGIALDTRTGTPIVVLNDKDNRRALPIWIGTAEASAIIRQLENIKSPRPMTHDLLFNTITQLGYSITHIEINDINTDTYYASVYLTQPGEEKPQILDARPSDAIALSLKAEAPIYATVNVVADGTISTDQERDDQETEEFHAFIQELKPSDFLKNADFNQDLETNQ
jgi:bifunctional DNase/RNase